tara:strand:- start:10491 stop:11279 length:789 start_codon:yes stop_codon:yes gene_type:complete
MSVYISDSPIYFIEAINSLLNQTKMPDEIIIIADGPIGNELNVALNYFKNMDLIRIIRLEKNCGLALSRKKAISSTSFDIIAVMDSDDICVPDRFEKQIKLLQDGKTQVVGGWIEEFVNEPRDKGKVRKTPINHKEIFSFGKWRNPINHVTLMFTKEAYDSVDGYSSVRHSEDWDMISRMLVTGVIIQSVPEVLVHVRAGDEMIERRRNIEQFKGEMMLFIKMYSIGYINLFHLFGNIMIRVVLRALPMFVTKFTYNSLLRK